MSKRQSDSRPPKQFDAVAMKRRLQDRIVRETEGMDAEALIAYFRAQAAAAGFANYHGAPPATGGSR